MSAPSAHPFYPCDAPTKADDKKKDSAQIPQSPLFFSCIWPPVLAPVQAFLKELQGTSIAKVPVLLAPLCGKSGSLTCMSDFSTAILSELIYKALSALASGSVSIKSDSAERGRKRGISFVIY
jgi:hypothetical protein